MHSEANHPSPNFSVRFTVLRSKLNGLQKNVSSLEERLYGLLCDLDGLVTLSVASPHLARHLPPAFSPELAWSERRRLLQQEAVAGARSVKITPLTNGAARIQIDGRPEISLPPAVAALLQILKADFGPQTDQMVGWKTIADIKQALLKRTGGAFTDRAAKQLVYRLRRKFEEHGENKFLIQSRRKLGYRIALRRGDGTLAESGAH
jgi:hypothetical protein